MPQLCLTTLTGVASVPKHVHGWLQHSYISLSSPICRSIMTGSQGKLEISGSIPAPTSMVCRNLLNLELKLTPKLGILWGGGCERQMRGVMIKILVPFPEKHTKNKGRYKQLLKTQRHLLSLMMQVTYSDNCLGSLE